MLNQIVLMGRLVRDPELRYTQNQTPITRFRIAVDRDFSARDGGEKQTDFFDVVTFNKSAEFVSKFFTKGSLTIVTGRLQLNEWTDRDNNKRLTAEVVADRVMFGESKRSREENGGGARGGDAYPSRGGDSYQPRGNNSFQSFDNAPSTSAYAGLSDADMNSTDGDLPF